MNYVTIRLHISEDNVVLFRGFPGSFLQGSIGCEAKLFHDSQGVYTLRISGLQHGKDKLKFYVKYGPSCPLVIALLWM